MKTIILDFGNGCNHGNNFDNIAKMIDETARLQRQTDRKLIVKFQTWQTGNFLIDKRLKSTNAEIFDKAYNYCVGKDLLCTSSVFDEWSLNFIEQYEVPFIKFACLESIWHLISLTTKKVIVSVPDYKQGEILKKLYEDRLQIMYAIRKYPAMPLDYIYLIQNLPDFDILDPSIRGLSDHTSNFSLYKKYDPYIYECHIALERNNNDPYGGEFIRTFKELEGNL